mmetsp:Transcript_17213/g.26089  ORF Transcript_17213/g.26089 Transcript_17213/m.26089 type:complete len:882 (-) Transcript_17213:853-3498(-)
MENDEASLSKLLSALAVGARAVHSLPLGDDFDYQASFPDFRSIARSTELDLIRVLSLGLNQDLDQDDPAIWNTCADVCDWLIEQAEIYLSDEDEPLELSHWSNIARQQAQSAYGRMLEGLVIMEKPQITYNIVVDNGRRTPFLPKGSSEAPQPGRANDTRYGGSSDVSFLGDDFVGPTHFVPHRKRDEILELRCTLAAPKNKPKFDTSQDISQASYAWVSTTSSLGQLAKKLKSAPKMAVDLEAHSYHSFAGIVCLMQISIVEDDTVRDYLVDTLALWHDIHSHLAEIFANPKILKVMHGADSDISWLQRDFGIYVVNLLDTGRASRLLKLPSFALAYLLKRYVDFDADKTHQLSDWRQRPLPDDMKFYARMDTHHLLHISEHMLWDIEHHSSKEVTIENVFEASRQVSLIRYDKEVFRINGYKSLIHNSKRKSKTELSDSQERVLMSLYDWRDSCARECDESPHYVCENRFLIRLALASPTTVSSLQSLLNPMPPLVLRFTQDVLQRIKAVMNQGVSSGPPSSAFFKPAEPEEEPRGLLSPVLGTEALYKQAGWMTPSVQDAIQDSTEEEEEEDEVGKKPKYLILVDNANKHYQSSGSTSHSLTMGRNTRGKAADGRGTANELSTSREIEEAIRSARQTASNVRKTIEKTNLLCLKSDSINIDDDEEDTMEDDDGKENEDSDAEFEIPKSMHEIYKVSNRNRRNKKSISGQGLDMNNVDEARRKTNTSEDADKLLAVRGAAYLDTISKRQKQDEEELPVSQEEDIAFMQEIGWIKDKEEVESLKPKSRDDSEEFELDEERTEKDALKPFDYSNVGNIGVYNPTSGAQPNPFFSGAAGSSSNVNDSTAGSNRDKGKRVGKGKRQQERPEKKEGKSFVYKKK